mgnify:CR=1 FL=1
MFTSVFASGSNVRQRHQLATRSRRSPSATTAQRQLFACACDTWADGKVLRQLKDTTITDCQALCAEHGVGGLQSVHLRLQAAVGGGVGDVLGEHAAALSDR